MNGATAVPSVRKIKNPNKNRKIIIGASHHFFLLIKIPKILKEWIF